VNISLDRLFEGIMATLRADVIPHVADPYARGQAVGVIDVLTNIGPRVEWRRAPLVGAVREKRELVSAVAALVPSLAAPQSDEAPEAMGSDELEGERDRLDAWIGEALAVAYARSIANDEYARQALGLLVKHAHDESTREMKLTRRPLFAEIASGREGDAKARE
jgi:hypothetical protein